jgi:hypothetical protein
LFSSTIRKTEPGRDGAVAEGDLRPAEGAEADEFAWWCARQLCCNRFWAGIAALAVALSPLKLVVATGLMSDVAYLAFLAATIRLEQHFGYNPIATYFVLTPNGKSESGFGTSWCAWHSAANVIVSTTGQHNKSTSQYGEIAYSYVPYQPDAGLSCGMNFVNQCAASHKITNCLQGPLGRGYFDGFSMVAGHEYADAITDPVPMQGWGDIYGLENADKCAWNPLSGNITIGGNYFAVQPLWSNAMNSGAGGCAMSGIAG